MTIGLLGKVKFLRWLRRQIVLWIILSISLAIADGYLYYQLHMLRRDRTYYTIELLKNTITKMQDMNNESVKVMTEVNRLIAQSEQERYVDNLAGIIVEHMGKAGMKANYFDVVKIIECSQKYVSAPFMYTDLLTLAWIESNYDPKTIGKHGERGVWQILAWQSRLKELSASDAFNIDTNCRMSVLELQEKYSNRKNVKDAIIAYNGWIVRDGAVMQAYYNIFTTRKKIVEGWCKEAKKKTKLW